MNQESPKYINDDIQRSNLLKMADLVSLSKQYTDRLEGEMTELKQRLESSKAVTKEIQITDNIVVSIKFINGVTQIPLTQAFAVNWGAIRLIRNLIMTQEGSKIPDAVTPRLETVELVASNRETAPVEVAPAPVAVVAPVAHQEVAPAPVAVVAPVAPQEVAPAPVAVAPVAHQEVAPTPVAVVAPVAPQEVAPAPVAVVAPVAPAPVAVVAPVAPAPVAVVAPVAHQEVIEASIEEEIAHLEAIPAPVAPVAPVAQLAAIPAPVAVVAPVAHLEVAPAPVAVVAPVAHQVIAAPVAVVAPVAHLEVIAAPVAIPTLATAELV
jgi:hypothetical protein